jgi:hypothetical protein
MTVLQASPSAHYEGTDTPLQSLIARANPRKAAPGLARRVVHVLAHCATHPPRRRRKPHGCSLSGEAL